MLFLFFFFEHKLKNQVQDRNQNITTLGEQCNMFSSYQMDNLYACHETFTLSDKINKKKMLDAL